MRFTERNNWRLFNLGMIFLLFGSCLISVACQTKEQKVESALKQCQQFLDKDDLDAATNCYGEAVKSNPESGGEISKAGKTAVFKKCVSYKERKDYQNAIVCFEGFTALEPKMANGYFQLADSYYQYHKEDAKANGQTDSELLDRAEQAIKSGLDFKSDDIPAHALYGQILSEKGNLRQALEEDKKIISLNPKIPLFWIDIAFIQQKLENNEEALKNYQQALILEPDNKLALYYLGALYEKTGKTDEAIATYEKLLKLQADYEDIAQRLENLKKMQNKKPNKSKAKTAGNP